MFTGIIKDVGEILSIKSGNKTMKVLTSFDYKGIDIGSSICCSGICLTVTQKGKNDDNSYFCADISDETLSKTSAEYWIKGELINLEKSLRFGDEVGGHLVTGHIDFISKIVSIQKDKNSNVVTIQYPNEYKKFIANKGSICLDGISLTVNEVFENKFSVNIIPHTENNTTWKNMKVGNKINTEVDIFSRYVSRQLEES